MEQIKKLEDTILELPGKPLCVLDRDLARIYGVNTTRLNEARERNSKKFVEGIDYFMLSRNEIETISHSDSLRYGPSQFCAYTKRGAYMFVTILNTDEAIMQAISVVEGFCTYSLLMEEIKAGRIMMATSPKQDKPEWIFNNMRRALLDRSPLWSKILRYKDLGLNHREISLLVHKEVTTVRKHVRRMEACGLLVPPKNLPKLQLCTEHFKNRLN